MSTIDSIVQLLDQLSEDRISAVVAAVDERQFDRQRSPLHFDTAIERLRSCRDILSGAIGNGFLSTFPQGIQNELFSILTSIVRDNTSIVDGADALGDLASNVDQLHIYVWNNRLAEKSSKIVNYAEKLDQLAKLTGDVQRLNAEFNALLPQAAEVQSLIQQSREIVTDATQALSGAQAANQQTVQYSQEAQSASTTLTESRTQIDALFEQCRASLQEMATLAEEMRRLDQESQQAATETAQSAQAATTTLTEAQERNTQVEALLTQAQSTSQEMSVLETSLRELGTEIQSLHQQTTQYTQEAQTALALANERNSQVDTLLGQARASHQDISTFEADLQKLYEESQAFRERMVSTEQSAQATIDRNTTKTSEIHEHLATLQEQIEIALQKAIGKGLFAAFYERSAKIARGKWIWAGAALLLAIFTLYETSAIVLGCTAVNSFFYFKLAVAIPLGYALWFCISQYGRERRLEEEYAFKSSISFSLAPYRDMVEKALSEQGQVGMEKYAEFLVDSVDKVFTSPFGQKEEVLPIDIKHMTQEQLKLFAELVSIALGRGK